MNKVVSYVSKIILVLYILCSTRDGVRGQSFELMPGTKRFFIDAQFLSFFDTDRRLSLFSRSRATSEYDDNRTDLFTGAYLNYTSDIGIGGTVLGRVSTNSSGLDAGVHYFKSTSTLMIYALASVNINDDVLFSWFSIFRYSPTLHRDVRLFVNIELFSAFGAIGHLSSVQRIRLGLAKGSYQFGGSVNLAENRMTATDVNPGIFCRKQF